MQNAQQMGQQQPVNQQQGSQAPTPTQQQGQAPHPTQPGPITDWASI